MTPDAAFYEIREVAGPTRKPVGFIYVLVGADGKDKHRSVEVYADDRDARLAASESIQSVRHISAEAVR